MMFGGPVESTISLYVPVSSETDTVGWSPSCPLSASTLSILMVMYMTRMWVSSVSLFSCSEPLFDQCKKLCYEDTYLFVENIKPYSNTGM